MRHSLKKRIRAITVFLTLAGLIGTTPAKASLMINEIMYDPAKVSDNDGEWFEIYNPDADVNLEGYSVSDLSTTVAINSSYIIRSGGYAVLGRNPDLFQNGGVNVDLTFSFLLNNSGTETLSIMDPNGVLIDSITYGAGTGFPSASGASICFTGTGAHGDGANWIDATTLGRTYGGGDYGTPGTANVAAVPEPASLVLLGSGLIGLLGSRRARG